MAEWEPAAIILDFDGVVVESVDIKHRAFRQLFADYPAQLDAILAYHEAHPATWRYEKFRVICRDLLHEPCDEARLRQLGERFSTLVKEAIIQCPFVPGAEEFLRRRSAHGPVFLVSATPHDELLEIVRRRGLTGYFRGVSGAPALKVEMMREILANGRWRPDQAAAIGDSLTDYTAARALTIPFFGRVQAGRSNPFPVDGTVRIVADLEELMSGWTAQPAASASSEAP